MDGFPAERQQTYIAGLIASLEVLETGVRQGNASNAQ
jgi:hypothetical protein